MSIVKGQGEAYEDSPVTLLARVVDKDGDNIVQSNLTSITYEVWGKDSTSTSAISTGTVTIASSVYDALQTGSPWTKDDTGYNFSHTLGTDVLSTANTRYLIQYDFTPTTTAGGGAYPIQFEVVTRKRY